LCQTGLGESTRISPVCFRAHLWALRYVSTEAVRYVTSRCTVSGISLITPSSRIGVAPSLSLQQPVVSMNPGVAASARPRTAPGTTQAATVTATSYPFTPVHGRINDPRLTSTVPNSTGAPAPTDEMGFITRPSSEGDESQAQPQSEPNSSSGRRRSRAGSALPQSNRLTVINPTDNEIPEDGPQTNTPGLTETLSQTRAPQQKAWLTAEEEKARLYQEAKARVERVQGGVDRAESVRVRLHSPSQLWVELSNSSTCDVVNERISDRE
jgi:hypothetical protein